MEEKIIKECETKNNIKNEFLAPTKWIFVSINLGDCKFLLFKMRENIKVIDITDNLRSDSTNLTDPGGRLGNFKGYFSSSSFFLFLFFFLFYFKFIFN